MSSLAANALDRIGVENASSVATDPSSLNCVVSPPTDLDRIKARNEAFKTALRNGDIPPELADELRLVPFDSPSGVRFQNAMEEIAKRFIKDWDPATQPVRFALMDLPGMNACQIRGAEPPLIAFNVGCFKETTDERGKKISPLKTVDEVALVFAHEQVHLAIERRYAPAGNSKLEEAMASYSSIEATYLAGYDPRAGLAWWREQSSASREWSWSEVLDEHPLPRNAVSIYETALTGINRKYGGIVAKPTPLDPSNDLCIAAREATHLSSLERELAARSYGAASTGEKIEILGELVKSGEYLDSRRLNDLCRVIRSLKGEVGNDRGEHDRVFAPLFDTVITLSSDGHDKGARRILAWIADSKDGYRPIGRLKPLADAAEAFVGATDVIAAREAARTLVSLGESEPLVGTQAGYSLLQRFAIPNFEYPDPDLVERKARRGSGVPLEWNEHIKLAREEYSRFGTSEIARAMLTLGVDDQRLYSSMDAPLALDFFTDSLIAISAGPRSGSSTIYDLHISGGRATKVGVINDERSREREDLKLQYLSRHAAATFEKLADIPEGEERQAMVQELERITDWVAKVDDADSTQTLLGLYSLKAAPELFVSLNESRLGWAESQLLVLGEVKRLVEMGEVEPIRKLLAELTGTRTISPPETSHAAESTFGAWRDSFGIGPELRVSLSASKLLEFALKAPPKIVPDSMKIKFLSTGVNWLGLLDYSLSVKRGTDDLHISAAGRKHLEGLVGELAPFMSTDRNRFRVARNWGELQQQIETFNLSEHPLGQQVVMAQAGILLSEGRRVREPTTGECVEILAMMQGELLGESDSLLSSRRVAMGDLGPFIRERFAENVGTRPTWSDDIGEAIAEWQTLYQGNVLQPATQYVHLGQLLDAVAGLPHVEQREHYETLLSKSDARIGDPDIRQRIAGCWADSIKQELGTDDGSSGYHTAVLEVVARVETTLDSRDKTAVLNTLAKTLMSQRELSQAIEQKSHVLTSALFASSHGLLIGLEGGAEIVIDSREKRFKIINFLSNPLSTRSVETLSGDALDWLEVDEDDPDRVSYKRRIDGQLVDLHKNFWAAPIEARAILMKEVLTPAEVRSAELIDDGGIEISVAEAKAAHVAEAFEYVLPRVFPDSSPHGAAARRWVAAYIEGMPEYSRHIALSALLVAGQRTEEAGKGTGFAIANFLESMGPAETKAGQAAQGHPKTPDEIRADLKRLKTSAAEPMRWELFNLIDESLGSGAENPISKVREVLGSASLFVAVDVELKDGSDAVVSLLRPHALDRARFGFELMGNMVGTFDQGSDSFRVMRELIGDASALAEIETNTGYAKLQRDEARRIYNDTTVNVGGRTITFQVPEVLGVGEGFVLSERAPGEHFIDLADTPERRDLAKAIMTVELNNILSGRPFDNDRHGGNCRVEGNTVHHFDFGGMMLAPPSDDDLRQLGETVVKAGFGATSVDDFVNRYFDVLRERQGEGEEISPVLKRAQKALLSIAEYSQGLSKDDLIDVLVSAAAHELHPAVREAVEGAVLGMLANSSFADSPVDIARLIGALSAPPIKLTRPAKSQ